MKYLCVTEVDAATKIPCTVEPQRTGPSMPDVKGLAYVWDERSTWPVETNIDGRYLRAAKYYCTCDDDADTSVAGVLEVLTEEAWTTLKKAELEARRPFPSWIGYLDTMSWAAPVARPANSITNGGNIHYQWDEATLNWLPID
jgi:hypothetical protein